MPFKAEKKAMKQRLAALGELSPRELDEGIFAIDSATRQRSAADVKNAQRATLEAELLKAIKRLYKKKKRPTRVSVTLQEGAKQTASGVDMDILVRVVWGESDDDMKFYLELPRSLGELLNHSRHTKLRTALSASLPSEIAFCIRSLDLLGVRRIGPGHDDAMTAKVRALLRDAAEYLLTDLRLDPALARWFSKRGVYVDDLSAAITKLS